MSRLKDKVVLITGSGMGLGQAMALLFSREGAKIVVPDINTEAGRGNGGRYPQGRGRRDFCPRRMSPKGTMPNA